MTAEAVTHYMHHILGVGVVVTSFVSRFVSYVSGHLEIFDQCPTQAASNKLQNPNFISIFNDHVDSLIDKYF